MKPDRPATDEGRVKTLEVGPRGLTVRVGRTAAWVAAGVCVLAIFLFVPTARAIQFFVARRWGRAMFGTAVVFAVLAALGLTLTYLLFDRKSRRVSNYLWTAATAGLYLYLTYALRGNPEESVHFIEYGVLGVALYFALSFSTRDGTIYPAAWLIGCLVGFFDEFLQWLTPLRYFDVRDVGINVLASLLVQVGIWKGVAPALVRGPVRLRTARRAAALLAANLVCLGLVISATPRRVARLARAVPGLSYLRTQEPVFEFKYRYRDPEIGVFHSRMTKREMVRTDRAKAREYVPILKTWQNRDYIRFLEVYPRLLYPFLQEFKAHVLRRDKMLDRARTESAGLEKDRAFVAARSENRILETYFPETLAATGWAWDEATRRRVEARAAKVDFAYVSTVAFTQHNYLNENLVWALLIAGFLAVAALWIVLGKNSGDTILNS
ncbi:MAG: VanZ family protein [Candidatus Aminicenantes bacterium]|nr:VanZ family protein [Candidatus Aminicenantes bacterium]